MNDENAFQAYLDKHPDDHTARLVFADWLQERDDPRAEGYLALGANKKTCQHYSSEGSSDGEDAYCYWDGGNGFGSTAYLPKDWLIAIVGYRPLKNPMSNFRNFGSRRECDDAAALAFAKLPISRRAKLLSSLTSVSV